MSYTNNSIHEFSPSKQKSLYCTYANHRSFPLEFNSFKNQIKCPDLKLIQHSFFEILIYLECLPCTYNTNLSIYFIHSLILFHVQFGLKLFSILSLCFSLFVSFSLFSYWISVLQYVMHHFLNIRRELNSVDTENIEGNQKNLYIWIGFCGNCVTVCGFSPSWVTFSGGWLHLL